MSSFLDKAAARASSGSWRASLARDLPASFVVFLVAMPLCMGIAVASGVPMERGLITGVIGGIVVGLIAGSPLQVSGPAAGLAVIVFEFVRQHGVDMLGPVLALAGLFQLAAGSLRAGGWFRAISPAVVHGMLAGIGILIVLAQMHVMTDGAPKAGGIDNLAAIPAAFFGLMAADGGDNLMALAIGLATIAAMLGWERIRPARLRLVPGALAGIVTGTLIAMVCGAAVSRVQAPEGILASLTLPAAETWARLGEPTMIVMAMTLAVIASAESLISAAAVDRMHDGPRTLYNRELGAQGIGNMLCGVLGGLPMTGVIVRSSANVQAGAATRLSTMMHGAWIMAFVLALPGLLAFVPTAALAGILVVTGCRLVGIAHMVHLRERYGLWAAGIWLATLVMVVATDLLVGVLTGLALSLAQAAPHLLKGRLTIERGKGVKGAAHTARASDQVSELRLSGAATFLQLPKLSDALEQSPRGGVLRIAAGRLRHIDHTCLEMIRDWGARQAATGARIEVVGGSAGANGPIAIALAGHRSPAGA